MMTLLGGFGAVAVLVIGGRLVIAGTITDGEFVAFGVYLVTLIWPMVALGWVVNLLQRARASMTRINAVLDERPAVRSPDRPLRPLRRPPAPGPSPSRACGSSTPTPATAAGSCRIFRSGSSPGRRSPSSGQTGAGKSTLADLIVRAYDPDRGRILLDGMDIRDLALPALRGRGRVRPPGNVSLQRHPAEQRPLRRARRRPAGAGRRDRPAERGHPLAAGGLRHHARGAGDQPLRGPETAGRHRPGAGEGSAGIRARRRAERGGRADGNQDPEPAPERPGGADHGDRFPPPRRGPGGRLRSWSSTAAGSWSRAGTPI